jgi:ABC-type sugar transport system permease subunit
MTTPEIVQRALADAKGERSRLTATTRARRVRWAEIRKSWQAYALLSPVLILLAVFMYYPPILGFVRSFQRWAPAKDVVFVGLSNYWNYFTYPETAREIPNMVKLMLAGLLTGVVVPFVAAELVFAVRSGAAKDLYRLLLVIPMLAPGIVTLLLWQYVYDPYFGPLNALFRSIGANFLARDWLGDPSTALYAIIFVGFPWVSGLGTLVYLGGLAQISESVFESCLLEGCTGLRRVIQIDLPLVVGQVRLLTILSVVGSMTSFDRVLVLTDGGPGFATMVPALSMYKRAFVYLEFGFASAIGMLLFAVALGFTVLVDRAFRPLAEETQR